MKEIPFKRGGLVAGAAISALIAAGVGPATQGTQQAHAASGTLVFPIASSSLWIRAADPAQQTDLTSFTIIGGVYNGLVRLSGSQVVPDLAAAMPSISADRLTYTFKLRSSLKFSDGTPLTSSDVVSSITRSLSKKEASPNAMLYLGHIVGAAALNSGKASTLTGVTAPDPSTVVIKIDKPIGYFLETLTYPTADVVKSTVTAGEDLVGPSAEYRNIGAGPLMFSKSKPWRYRQEIYLSANPNYYNASKMQIKEVDYPFVSSVETLYNEYLSGQVPISAVPSAFIASVRNKPDFHTHRLFQIDYLVPNESSTKCKPISCAPFNDVHFRRALAYAINRDTIDSKILHGLEAPLCSLIPVGIAGSDDTTLCPLSTYNPARAKAELALAKKDFGGKLPNEGSYTAIYPSGAQDTTNEFTELQSEWAAVGININVTSTPLNNWYNLLSSNYSPFVEAGWIDDYPDPQDFAENLLSTSSVYNIGNYANPQFQKLILQGDTMPPGPERDKVYVNAQKIAMNDAAYIVIGQVSAFYRWKSNIHGLWVDPNYDVWPDHNDWTKVSVS